MIAEIFYILLIIAFSLLFYGYYSRTAFIILVGYGFLFIAGTIIIAGIDFNNGQNIVTVGLTTTITPIVYTYNSIILGVLVCAMSIGGFTMEFFNRRVTE